SMHLQLMKSYERGPHSFITFLDRCGVVLKLEPERIDCGLNRLLPFNKSSVRLAGAASSYLPGDDQHRCNDGSENYEYEKIHRVRPTPALSRAAKRRRLE